MKNKSYLHLCKVPEHLLLHPTGYWTVELSQDYIQVQTFLDRFRTLYCKTANTYKTAPSTFVLSARGSHKVRTPSSNHKRSKALFDVALLNHIVWTIGCKWNDTLYQMNNLHLLYMALLPVSMKEHGDSQPVKNDYNS